MKCLRLTSNAYLLGFGTLHAGLLLQQGDEYLYLSTKKRLPFKSLEAVEKRFGKLELVELEGGTNELTEINAYPVKHSDAVLISSEPARYSRGGHGRFAAGYWAIHYQHGWTLTFCPREDTIDSNEAIGPFKSRLEVFNKIASLKHSPKDLHEN